MRTNIHIFLRTRSFAAAAVLVALFSTASAQSYKHKLKSFQNRASNYTVLGVTASMGVNTYKFKSDIEGLSGLKVFGEGWNAEIIAGNSQYKFRGGFGKYHSDKSSVTSINQTQFTGKLNVSPNALFGQSKFVRFYLLTGFDYNVYQLNGITIPQPVMEDEDAANKKRKPKKICSCLSPNPLTTSALTDPDTFSPSEANLEDETISDGSESAPESKIKKGQVNGGLGMEINIVKKGYFLRLFGEGYYGIPMNEIIDNIGLNKTKISPQLMINFGVGIGIWR